MGSHRLHPSTAPDLLAEVHGLLGDDLQFRPRNGRIRMAGRWLRFPLRAQDLVTRLPPRLAAGAARDALTFAVPAPRQDTFAEVAGGLGPTMADASTPPTSRSSGCARPTQCGELARRRVSADGPVAIAKRLVIEPSGGATFYPRRVRPDE
jgi:hypothetical protein